MEVIYIKIDIGILPQSYVSDEPESGGYFPFAIDGETSYLYDISFAYRKNEKEVEDFVAKWMKSLNKFPKYSKKQVIISFGAAIFSIAMMILGSTGS